MDTDNTTPELLKINDFVRRRLAKDRLSDPVAREISAHTIRTKILQGKIEKVVIGGQDHIDWNKYHDYPFRQYFQIPKRCVVEITHNQTT